MSKVIKRPSLAQLFDAPDGFRGISGWICGYSGDVAFFRDAIERFSQVSHNSRGASGNLCLAVMLDPHNPPISPVNVPGLAHLLFKENPERPFRLLHAKVAILGFRSNANSEDWMIRLIVCTGNWTRKTIEENLDLAWHVEIKGGQLKSADNDSCQTCVDIQAAWNMVKWLRDWFDTRLIDSAGLPGGRRETQTTDSYNWFEQTMKQVDEYARPGKNFNPRYCDNRDKSLLDQLPDMIERQAGKTKRNYIAMGSGFFEANVDKNTVPPVLDSVTKRLKERALLTKSPEVDVFVNPKGCQAVAGSLAAIKDREYWTVRPAGQPKYFGSGGERSLHAKFIFSANYRESSNNCNSAWIYLGSGNLTNPGFCQPQSKSHGNLEAGTVLAPTELYWYEGKAPVEKVVSNLLPLQWEVELGKDSDISTGEDFEPTEETYIAPPVAYLVWTTTGGNIGELSVTDEEEPDVDVLDPDAHPCKRNTNGSFHWRGDQPRQVRVAWPGLDKDRQHPALVPVIDELGRIAAARLPPVEIQDIWWRLEDFPASFEEDSIDSDDGSPEEVPNAAKPVTASGETVSSYPIRTMMELIEKIANRQTSISRTDWNSWCIRLEHTLTQAAESDVLNTFRKIRVNPLSPLREKPFRPDFAETAENNEGKQYENLLDRVEKIWKVHDLEKLEAKG